MQQPSVIIPNPITISRQIISMEYLAVRVFGMTWSADDWKDQKSKNPTARVNGNRAEIEISPSSAENGFVGCKMVVVCVHCEWW